MGRQAWLCVAPAATDAPGQLRLIDTLALSNRCCLHLVAAANCQILVGMDQSGLKSLVTLPERFETLCTNSRHRLQSLREMTESERRSMRFFRPGSRIHHKNRVVPRRGFTCLIRQLCSND